MKNEFAKNGYYILRNALTHAEVDRLAGPIRAALAAAITTPTRRDRPIRRRASIQWAREFWKNIQKSRK